MGKYGRKTHCTIDILVHILIHAESKIHIYKSLYLQSFKIQDFLKYFLGIGVAQEDIGIITPYHAQVIALKKALHDLAKRIRVGTVEEFQGEEKMIIMFSAVKTSGTNKALEFIYCPKRLNTAISRARLVFRHCFVIFFFLKFND